jgi:hypothetical protein
VTAEETLNKQAVRGGCCGWRQEDVIGPYGSDGVPNPDKMSMPVTMELKENEGKEWGYPK